MADRPSGTSPVTRSGPGSGAGAVPFEDVVDILQTGDVLLFHGENSVSREVEIATGSPFSHCAMVIRHDRRAAPMIWQAGPGGIVVDPTKNQKHGGAQLGDITETMRLMEDPKYHDTGYLRRLTLDRPADFDDLALRMVADLDGRPFPSMLKMVEDYVLGRLLHVVSPERTLFCAELVALTYERLGLLPAAPPANAYAPGSFSEKNRALPLQMGARLGGQIRLMRPGTLSPPGDRSTERV